MADWWSTGQCKMSGTQCTAALMQCTTALMCRLFLAWRCLALLPHQWLRAASQFQGPGTTECDACQRWDVMLREYAAIMNRATSIPLNHKVAISQPPPALFCWSS